MKLYKSIFKRLFDILFSLLGLIILLPLLFTVFLLVYINTRINPFFSQERPGKNAKRFNVLKFKTMSDARGSDGKLLPDDMRLTKMGKFLRAYSIDELPQLFNVLIGDMSIVGPRPLLTRYLSLYNSEQYRRHNVRPGITGWAQVNGRNNIPWKNKFEFDVYYVDNLSFVLDFKIFILSIKKVFLKENVSKEGHATTEGFNGNN